MEVCEFKDLTVHFHTFFVTIDNYALCQQLGKSKP